MEINFEQLATALTVTSFSSNIIRQITGILQKHIDESLSSFVDQSYQSILTLEYWTWSLLSTEPHQVTNQPYCVEFLHTLASFNKEIIFNCDSMKDDLKGSLLIPETITQINQIIQQIDHVGNDYDQYIIITSRWFENLSFLIQEYPHLSHSIIIIELNQYFERHLIMNNQLKTVILLLQQSPSLICTKEFFDTKISLFLMNIYFQSRPTNSLVFATKILQQIASDYLQIIQTCTHTIAAWGEHFLACLACLISFVCNYSWRARKDEQLWKIIFPTEQILCEYVQALIRILEYKSFYKQIKPKLSNYETILFDSILFSLQYIVQTRDMNWYLRSITQLPDLLLKIAESSTYYHICLCIYSLCGEIMCDDKLKTLQFTETMSSSFFHMLEDAYHHPSRKYKQIPFSRLLKGINIARKTKCFLSLSKNDSIQQKTADLKEVPFLIQISDEYSIVYDILWALSFNHDIQQQLRSNTSFISKLTHLAKDCENEQMRKITHGLLWNLQYSQKDYLSVTNNEKKTFDIMISYSHKDRDLCKQLYGELIKIGYHVWIDFDHMHGNVMDAMAQAIESSQTVILCMSEEYRKSNYCRAEAHYAFQRQRKIVPVLLQKRYKPDGWLLFLVGQLLYVDFAKYEFNRAMEMLHKELKIEDNTRSITKSLTRSISVKPFSGNILEWTSIDVQQWLTEQHLTQMSRLLKNCNGRSLMYLHEFITNGKLDEIFSLLKEDAQRRIDENLSLIEFSCFRSLMDEQKEALTKK